MRASSHRLFTALAAIILLLTLHVGDAAKTIFLTKQADTASLSSTSPTTSEAPTTGAPTTRPTSIYENIPSPATELFRFDENLQPLICNRSVVVINGKNAVEVLDLFRMETSADGNVAVVRVGKGKPIEDDYGGPWFRKPAFLVIRRRSPFKSFSVVQRIPFHTTNDKELIRRGPKPWFSLAISGDGSTIAIGTIYCDYLSIACINRKIHPLDRLGRLRVFTRNRKTGKYDAGAAMVYVQQSAGTELHNQGMDISISHNGQTIFARVIEANVTVDPLGGVKLILGVHTFWGWRKSGNKWTSQGMINAASANCPGGHTNPEVAGLNRDGTRAAIICGVEHAESGVVLQHNGTAWTFDGSVSFLSSKNYVRVARVEFVSDDKFIVNAYNNYGPSKNFDSTWFYTRTGTSAWTLTHMVPNTISPHIVRYGPDPVVLLSFKDWSATGVFTVSPIDQTWIQTYTYKGVADEKGTVAPAFVVHSTTLLSDASQQGTESVSWVCPQLPPAA